MQVLRKLFLCISFFLLSVASVYCVTLFVDPAVTLAEETDTSSKESTSAIKEKEEPVSSKAPEVSSEKVSSAAPVSAQGTVKGKIITRCISAGSGNLKYNNVSIKNSTSLKIDLKTELLAGPSIRLQQTSEPQVLIMHTHTTECFMLEDRDYYSDSDLSRTTDDAKNIVAVGEVLKSGLEAKGIGVIHATEKHDYPEYTGSYTRSAVTVKKYLEKHPTIKVVIDLHRDAMMDSEGTKTAVVSEIKGKKAAQLMIVAGCESGDVTGYPNWRQNFRLAIKLQQSLEVMYPTLARPMLFTERKYNQHLTPGSILIECGTDANTLEQAKYSATLLADSLALTLNMLKEN